MEIKRFYNIAYLQICESFFSGYRKKSTPLATRGDEDISPLFNTSLGLAKEAEGLGCRQGRTAETR